MSVLTQLNLIVSGEARPLKIAPKVIYSSSFITESQTCEIVLDICLAEICDKLPEKYIAALSPMALIPIQIYELFP